VEVLTLRTLSRTIFACLLGISPFALAAPATAPAIQLPPALAEYAPLAQQCARFQELVLGATWRTIYQEDFSGRGAPTWSSPTVAPVAQPGANPHLRLTRDEGRSVLYFEAAGEQGLLHIGPKVSGDFVVDIVAKSVSENPCDISLFCDRIDAGPGFQFGANFNTRNKLWVGPVKPQPGGDAKGPKAQKYVELPAEPLIVKNTWHRVRMEVREGQILGWVDGKLVVRAPLEVAYDRTAQRQPLVYVYASAIQLREARIETLAPGAKKVSRDEAWAKVFGETKLDQVKEKLQFLVDCLAHDDEATRNGAELLLKRAGELAVPALEQAAANGMSEQKVRAGVLLRVLRPRPVTQPAPPRAQPPPLQPIQPLAPGLDINQSITPRQGPERF
jgi:hypothetical protein